MANSVEPDQTAPLRSILICFFTVCFHLSVLILRLFYGIRCVLLLRNNDIAFKTVVLTNIKAYRY